MNNVFGWWYCLRASKFPTVPLRIPLGMATQGSPLQTRTWRRQRARARAQALLHRPHLFTADNLPALGIADVDVSFFGDVSQTADTAW